jgi:undecaprenyl-diphosphatase
VISQTLTSVVLGIVEGLTEFLPISSTGHLILVGHWLKFEGEFAATFDIAIQLGAILAVVIHYRDFFFRLLHPKNWLSRDVKLIFIAISPALLLGFLLHRTIKTYLFGESPVIAALIVGGIVMALVDRLTYEPKTFSVSDVSYKQAFIIGLCQCFSLWPGMSRSGSTIVGGLVAKLDYATAAQFSFIISVPVMMAATGYDLLKSHALLTQAHLFQIGVGFLVSFLVAYLAIVTFLKLIVKVRLMPFAIYRLILGVLLLI